MKKKDAFDYMTPQEQNRFTLIVERSTEIAKEIKKLEIARSRNTRKALRLFEIVEMRMKEEDLQRRGGKPV